MAASNDRFASVTTELGETVPLQTPARPGKNLGRSFRTPTSAMDSRPRSQQGTGFGGDLTQSQEATLPTAGRHELWKQRDGSQGGGTGSGGSAGAGDTDMMTVRQSIHVPRDEGRTSGGKQGKDDVFDRKVRHHKNNHGLLLDETTAEATPTPPLASHESRGSRGKGKKKGRSSDSGSSAQSDEAEEASLALPSIEEARREFEAEHQQIQQSLTDPAENAAGLGHHREEEEDMIPPAVAAAPATTASPQRSSSSGPPLPPPPQPDWVSLEASSSLSEEQGGSAVVAKGARPHLTLRDSPRHHQPACPPGVVGGSLSTSATGAAGAAGADADAAVTGDSGGTRSSSSNGATTRCHETGVVMDEAATAAAAAAALALEAEDEADGVPNASSSSASSSPSSSRGTNGRAAAATGDLFDRSGGGGIGTYDVGDDARPPQVTFDVLHEGVGLEGAATLTLEAAGGPDIGGARADILTFSGRGGSVRDGSGSEVGSSGGGGGAFAPSNGMDGMIGPVSAFSQALHMALAFVVLVLVAFAKADDGAFGPASYGSGTGSGGASAGSASSTSGRRASKGGGGDSFTRKNSEGTKQRRKTGGGAGHSFTQSSPVARRLRAAWSKVWYIVEEDLSTRWHAAGRLLVSLRRAWAALWVLPPHAEAEVLAEALASTPHYSQGDAADRRRRGAGTAGGGGGGGSGSGSGSQRVRRRASRRGSRSAGALAAADAPTDEEFLGRPVGLNCLNLLSLCGYRPLSRAGGGRGSRAPKYMLLLDLDQTLVHCSAHLMEPSRRRSGGVTRAGAVRPDLKLEMRGGAPSDRPACMYAWKRPHLDVFLGVVSRWYEVAVFTSGHQSFAEPLIDIIDSRCVIGKRFYRDSCTQRECSSPRETGRFRSSPPATPSAASGVGFAGTPASASTAPGSPSETVKDLRVVRSEHFPLRMVLVDNQPRTVVQQANVLPVKSWYPRDSQDRQLLDLLPVLLALTSCQDVRNVLSLRTGAASVPPPPHPAAAR